MNLEETITLGSTSLPTVAGIANTMGIDGTENAALYLTKIATAVIGTGLTVALADHVYWRIQSYRTGEPNQ